MPAKVKKNTKTTQPETMLPPPTPRPSQTVEPVAPAVDASEDSEAEALSQIFDILHLSVDNLHERFEDFYENPNKDKYLEFETVITEFITLARDLKNNTKSLLPASEKPQGDKRGRKKKIPTVAIEDNPPAVPQ